MNIYVLFIKVESEKYEINTAFNNIYYTLEDAISKGIIELKNICLDYYDINEISDNKLKKFYINKNLYYEFQISVINSNRKRFNTSKELMDYFNTNIKNISNNNLYDFLLSLVDSITVLYDYFGNILYTHIDDASPIEENVYYSKIDFNEEDCKKGIYTFEYR